MKKLLLFSLLFFSAHAITELSNAQKFSLWLKQTSERKNSKKSDWAYLAIFLDNHKEIIPTPEDMTLMDATVSMIGKISENILQSNLMVSYKARLAKVALNRLKTVKDQKND